jgi:hypothetical protein
MRHGLIVTVTPEPGTFGIAGAELLALAFLRRIKL